MDCFSQCIKLRQNNMHENVLLTEGILKLVWTYVYTQNAEELKTLKWVSSVLNKSTKNLLIHMLNKSTKSTYATQTQNAMTNLKLLASAIFSIFILASLICQKILQPVKEV